MKKKNYLYVVSAPVWFRETFFRNKRATRPVLSVLTHGHRRQITGARGGGIGSREAGLLPHHSERPGDAE